MSQFQVSFSSFVSAELAPKEGKRQALHSFRLGMLEGAAVLALTSGNATQILQAQQTALQAKGSLAKAYRAGFAAMGKVSAMERAPGKVTAAITAAATELAQPLIQKFSEAFLIECPLEVPERTEEQKEAAKAKADAKALARAKELGLVEPGSVAGAVPMGPAALVDLMVSMLATGQISGENLAELTQACKAANKAAKASAKEMQPA